MKLILQRPDTFGAIASTLCIIHCVATPFLFVVHSCALSGCESTPSWWNNLDYFFLTISFMAIYHSIKTTSKNFIKIALWVNWTVLLAVIVNEKSQWISLPETITDVVAFTLAVLHIYNLNFCQCKTNKCCVKNG